MKANCLFLCAALCSWIAVDAMERTAESVPLSKRTRSEDMDQTLSRNMWLLPLFERLLTGNNRDLEKALSETLPHIDTQKLKLLVGRFNRTAEILEDHLSTHCKNNCLIECNPAPALLAKLRPPVLTNNVQEKVLQTTLVRYKVPQQLVELSATLQGLLLDMEESDMTLSQEELSLEESLKKMAIDSESSVIHLDLKYPHSLRPVIECLKKIVALCNTADYGKLLHEELKPIVCETNLLHLLTTVHYLDVPILYEYLAAYLISYLSSEKDLDTLKDFLEQCQMVLSKDERNDLVNRMLRLQRGIFMQVFATQKNQTHFCSEYSKEATSTSFIRPDGPFVYVTRDTNDYTIAVYACQDNAFTCTYSTKVSLPPAKKVVVNSKGTRVVFQKEDNSLYVKDLLTNEDPVLIAHAGANPADDCFQFVPELGIFVRRHAECKSTSLIDPDYPAHLVFPGHVLAYNGHYAATSFSNEEYTSEKSTTIAIWHIKEDGTIIPVKNSVTLDQEVPSPTCHYRRKSHYLLSPKAEHLIRSTGSDYFSLSNGLQRSLDSEVLYGCSESRLFVKQKNHSDYATLSIIDDNSDDPFGPSYSFDTRSLSGSSVELYINANFTKVMFLNDDSRIVLIYQVYDCKTELLYCNALIIDLFGNATGRTLADLVCILNHKQRDDSPYLQSVYKELPELVRQKLKQTYF